MTRVPLRQKLGQALRLSYPTLIFIFLLGLMMATFKVPGGNNYSPMKSVAHRSPHKQNDLSSELIQNLVGHSGFLTPS